MSRPTNRLPIRAVEEALGQLLLEEADDTRRLSFGLSDEVREAATRLREELAYRADLYEARRRAHAVGRKLDDLAVQYGIEGSTSVQLSELNSPIYTQSDSHGVELICFDDTILNRSTPSE